ncbi:MAG: D-alanine--D-alanine ligase [bacterium]
MKEILGKLRVKKIGVLCGGSSQEREVSLRTGDAVYKALVFLGLNVSKLDVDREIALRLAKERIDLAFIALHGKLGEDGTIQGLLEIMGIPYTGSGVLASALALDKVYTKEVFSYHNLPMAKYKVLEKRMKTAGNILKELDYPVVVKPAREGSTIGVTVVRERSGLDSAINLAFGYGNKILIEEYIEGREITVGILGDEPLPVIEIVSKTAFYDYQAKYEPGMSKHIVPAKLQREQYELAQSLALSAHSALGCRGATRVDMVMDGEGKIYLLEVNTIPGMTETSLLPEAAAVAGIDFKQLVVEILSYALD